MIRIEIDPVPKPRMTQSDRWKKRPCVLRYRSFCDELRAKTLTARYVPDGQIKVDFVVPMPPSWTKKKRQQMNLDPHRQTPDLDNLVKAFLDALMVDDSGIHSINAKKIWGDIGQIIIYNGD